MSCVTGAHGQALGQALGNGKALSSHVLWDKHSVKDKRSVRMSCVNGAHGLIHELVYGQALRCIDPACVSKDWPMDPAMDPACPWSRPMDPDPPCVSKDWPTDPAMGPVHTRSHTRPWACSYPFSHPAMGHFQMDSAMGHVHTR